MSQDRFKITPELKIYLNLVERIVSFEYDSPELGKIAVKTVLLLLKKGEVLSEDKIATQLNVETSEVRKILQILFKHGLVSVEREVIDPDRGRYETRWYIDSESINRMLRSRIKNVLNILEHVLKSISNEAYYYCPTCFRRYTVDEAYDYDFKCPRDDAYLVQSDQYREVEALMNIIKKLKDGFKM